MSENYGVKYTADVTQFEEMGPEYFQSTPYIDTSAEPIAGIIKYGSSFGSLAAPDDSAAYQEMDESPEDTVQSPDDSMRESEGMLGQPIEWIQQGGRRSHVSTSSTENLDYPDVEFDRYGSYETRSKTSGSIRKLSQYSSRHRSSKATTPSSTWSTSWSGSRSISELKQLNKNQLQDMVRRGIISSRAMNKVLEVQLQGQKGDIQDCFGFCPCRYVFSIRDFFFPSMAAGAAMCNALRQGRCKRSSVWQQVLRRLKNSPINPYRIYVSLAYWISYVCCCLANTLMCVPTKLGYYGPTYKLRASVGEDWGPPGLQHSGSIWCRRSILQNLFAAVAVSVIVFCISAKLVPGRYYVDFKQSWYGGLVDVVMFVTRSPLVGGYQTA